MKLQLTILQRMFLTLMVSAEKEGDRHYWKLVDAAMKVLPLSDAEMDKYGVWLQATDVQFGYEKNTLGTKPDWIEKSNRPEILKWILEKKEYTLPDRLVYLVIEKLEALDKEKKLNRE